MKTLLVGLFLIIGCNSQENLSEEEKAHLIAQKAIISERGEEGYEAQKPYTAVKDGDDWIITGAGNCQRGYTCEGGKHTVVIEGPTGRVKDFYTTQEARRRTVGTSAADI